MRSGQTTTDQQPIENIVWSPQSGPQHALIECPVYEIFYGGARGGGKTDGVLGKMAIKAETYGTAFNCIFFRHELPMLDDAINRSQEIFGPLGATWNDQKKTWKFPGGGRLRFRPLERVKDAEKYQGQNVSDVCIEEAGNFADPAPILRLHAVLRSARGIPTQMHLTGNPGGPGQLWIKHRYIDPAPEGYKILTETFRFGKQEFKRNRVFIPALVTDNKILLENDPNYIGNLFMVGSAELVRAWLEGDWNAIEGAYFDCWSRDMVIKPFEIPDHWTRIRSFDWGSAKPFSVGWWAVASEDLITTSGVIPKNAMVRYREWYGAAKDEAGVTKPNIGLKLKTAAVAKGIAQRETEKIHKQVADPAIFAEDGGPSIAEEMYNADHSIKWQSADNKRIPGWSQMRQRMEGDEDKPMVYVFDTCTDSIRTIPALQHDDIKPEDLDTDGEDHAADEWRYGLMARPWTKPKPQEPEPIKGIESVTLNDLWNKQPQRKRI